MFLAASDLDLPGELLLWQKQQHLEDRLSEAPQLPALAGLIAQPAPP